MLEDVMHDYWRSLCESLQGPRLEAGAMNAFRRLENRYSEPHRHYHTLAHIEACVRELHEFTARMGSFAPNDSALVELALWYHDAVYHTLREDNEEKSADLACRASIQLFHLQTRELSHLKELIMATAHRDIPRDPDAKIVCDIDLSSLGAAPDVFDRNTMNIRREYNWMPEAEFNAQTEGFFLRFLHRPTIYTTPYFQAKYEDQARRNLTRVLESLGSRRST